MVYNTPLPVNNVDITTSKVSFIKYSFSHWSQDWTKSNSLRVQFRGTTVKWSIPPSPSTSSLHPPLLDWEPQADISRPRKSTSGPWSWDRRPVSWPVRLSFSTTPPGQPIIILRESQHDGFTAVGDPGWGCHCSPGQAGFVNNGSQHSCSASWTSSPLIPSNFFWDQPQLTRNLLNISTSRSFTQLLE